MKELKIKSQPDLSMPYKIKPSQPYEAVSINLEAQEAKICWKTQAKVEEMTTLRSRQSSLWSCVGGSLR